MKLAERRGPTIDLVGSSSAPSTSYRMDESALPVWGCLIVHNMIYAIFVSLQSVVETYLV